MTFLDNLAERRRDVRPAKGRTLVEERAALEYLLATEGWRMGLEQRGTVAQRIRVLGGDPTTVTILAPLRPKDVSDLYDDDEDL